MAEIGVVGRQISFVTVLALWTVGRLLLPTHLHRHFWRTTVMGPAAHATDMRGGIVADYRDILQIRQLFICLVASPYA